MRPLHKFLALGVWCATAILSFWLSVGMTPAEAGPLLAFSAVSFGFNMTGIGFIYNSRYARELYNKISGSDRHISTVRKYFFASGVASMAVMILIIYAPILKKIALCIAEAIFDNDFAERIGIFWSATVYATVSVNLLLMSILLRFVLQGMVQNARNYPPSKKGGEQ